MRTVVLAAVGLLIAAPPTPAQDQPATGWAAKIFTPRDGDKSPLEHNFGNVPRGAFLQYRMPITNIYAVPLQVSVKPSCNCVTATPNPAVLKPQETGSIDITMDASKFMGDKVVWIEVGVQHADYQPRFWSNTQLTIKGHCQTDVMLEPAQALFGIVPVGQPVSRDVVIRYFGRQAWQVYGPAANQATPFDVTPVQSQRAGEFRMRLTLRQDTQPGNYKGELQLGTSDQNNPVVMIPYDVTVQAPLTVSPAVSRLGTIKVGETKQHRLMVRGSTPFRILAIDGQGDGVTAQFRSDVAGQAQVVTISVQPTQPGQVQKVLTIRTDLNGGATTTATVEATAVAQ